MWVKPLSAVTAGVRNSGVSFIRELTVLARWQFSIKRKVKVKCLRDDFSNMAKIFSIASNVVVE